MKIKNRVLRGILKYLTILVASVIYAAGVSLFFDANQLAPGGVTGIAILISHFTPIETGTAILLINVPILLYGAWKFGGKFIISTVYCIGMISLFTNFFGRMTVPTNDLLIAAVSGGVLVAIGLALVFKSGATTGGIDIFVKALRQKYPHMRTGTMFRMVDVCVITLSGVLFGNFELAMYAAIGVFVCTAIMDKLLYGSDEAKLLFVISDHHELIAERIMNEVDSGVTILDGVGAYSSASKKIIMCAVKKHQAAKVEDVVKEADSSAFMIVSSASEIFGEGYKSYMSEKI